MNSSSHYDVAIIGAGMSGLAAGIRLAHFGRKVCIFERHNAVGGLNGFYSLGGRKFDVGLHAMTNFVRPGVKGTPLTKLLRQLRIDRDEFALCEQKQSRVAFGPRGETEGTPEFFDTRRGVAGLQPLHDRIQFLTEGGLVTMRQPQLELKPFDRERLKDVGLRLRQLYPMGDPNIVARDGTAFREQIDIDLGITKRSLCRYVEDSY